MKKSRVIKPKRVKTREIRGDSVLIAGYGREGKSTEAWLTRHYPSLRIDRADKVTNGPTYLAGINRYETVIRSPGVSPYQADIRQYLKNGGHVTSATNIFFSLVKGKTIGITGTKGKSTTTSLIAHILKGVCADVRLVGNIGTPMLDELDSATPETVFVIELSSHQLVDIRYSPNIAVILGIVAEHLDYYPDFSSYVGAKSNIVKYQKASDAVVYNAAYREVAAIVKKSNAVAHPFVSSDAGAFSAQLLGNAENIVAAATVARLMGVSDPVIRERTGTFVSLPHRLELIGTYRGIRFYNDSLATIPQATIHALDALGPDVATLIAGGYDRKLDYAALGMYLGAHPVSTLILFPDTGHKIWESIPQNKRYPIRMYHVTTMEEAVKLAYEHTPEGNICLLSPASASYNLFRDYADRGEQFAAWARKLGASI